MTLNLLCIYFADFTVGVVSLIIVVAAILDGKLVPTEFIAETR